MIQQQYPSQLLERAVQEFAKLPGVGRKTALRLVLHLLRQDTEDVEKLTNAIQQMKYEVKRCSVCHNISDSDVCPICSDPHRDASTVCVVENIQDVMAVENTQQFTGLYHVLGGVISPMDGLGPSDIEIDSLIVQIGIVALVHQVDTYPLRKAGILVLHLLTPVLIVEVLICPDQMVLIRHLASPRFLVSGLMGMPFSS